MAKHTPGPWTNDGGLVCGLDSRPRLAGTPSEDIFNAYEWGTELRDEAMANAALIAAAPDLLAALQDIMNARWVPAGMREDHCDAARAAIYKATMEAMEPMREDAARLARLETAAREYIEAWDDSDHVSDEALHAKRNALRAALESPA